MADAPDSVDDRDLEILARLMQDSRIPWRRLAKMLGVSEATIYMRVKRLMEAGVIRGFTLDVDPERLGLAAVAYIMLRVDAPHVPKVRSSLRSNPLVVEVYEIAGDYNFMVKAVAPSHRDLTRLTDELSSTEGVREAAVYLVLRKVKDGASLVEAYKAWKRLGEPGKD